MTKFDFSDAFKELFNVFSASNEENKIKGYYEYFQDKKAPVFRNCVKTWIQRKYKFPSVSELLELYDMLDVQEKFTGCGTCSGSGWVYPENGEGVKRGNCPHGERLAKYAGDIHHGPQKFNDGVFLNQTELEIQWAKDIMNDPRKFVSGYKYIAPILFRQNKPLFDRVESIAKECLGPKYFDSIWLNAKTYEQKTKLF